MQVASGKHSGVVIVPARNFFAVATTEHPASINKGFVFRRARENPEDYVIFAFETGFGIRKRI